MCTHCKIPPQLLQRKISGYIQIVGLPDAAVQESKERVRPAVQNSGFSFPIENARQCANHRFPLGDAKNQTLLPSTYYAVIFCSEPMPCRQKIGGRRGAVQQR